MGAVEAKCHARLKFAAIAGGISEHEKREVGAEMTKKTNPRICEVLGEEGNPIEIGQVFGFRNETCGPWKITQDGYVINNDGSETTARLVCDLINYRGLIVRKPRFTEEEVADAKVLARALPVDGFERNADGDVFIILTTTFRMLLNGSMFPSLLPGQAVTLNDVIGGEVS